MTTVYGDLVRYRELFGNLFRRDVQAKYRGSLLGLAWTLANPVLLMAVYLLVFSVLWETPFGTEGHYALFLLVGLSAWIFFATSVQSASRSMLDNANLIRKTRFPRQLLPLSVVATHLVSFGLAVVALTSGLALAIASLNVLFRDIEFLVSALLLPLFFLTPVLYPLNDPQIARRDWVVDLIHWGNPLSPVIEALRDPLFYGRLPNLGDTIYTVVVAVVALALGAWVFSRVDDQIAVEV
jgi:homopolymeric O-antigen transport system permease protein